MKGALAYGEFNKQSSILEPPIEIVNGAKQVS